MLTRKENGRNGVAMATKAEHFDNILELIRIDDRLKVLVKEEVINVISAYTSQQGCSEVEKDAFWRILDGHKYHQKG